MGSAGGLTSEQIREVDRFEESPHFTADERTVLRLGDALTSTPARVPDDLYADALALLGERGLVELTSAIAWENYRARFNRAFEVESEGFCLLPDRDQRAGLVGDGS